MEHSLTNHYVSYMEQRKDFPMYHNFKVDYKEMPFINISIKCGVFMRLTDKILWDIIIRFFRRIGLESLRRNIEYYIRVEMSYSCGVPIYWFYIERKFAVNIDDYEAGEAEEKEMGAVFRKLYLDVVSEICKDWNQTHERFLELSQAAIVRYRARSYYCMSDEEVEIYKKSLPWNKERKGIGRSSEEQAKIDADSVDLTELEELGNAAS